MREKKKQQLIKYASLKLVDTLVIYLSEREEKKLGKVLVLLIEGLQRIFVLAISI